MQHSDTSSKILQAAARLFADQGVGETTLRQITSLANVNLAAVNYHFGSKNGLVLAVAEAYITPLMDNLEAMLDERQALVEQTISLEDLVEMLMCALLRIDRQSEEAISVFMRLLDLAYMRQQDELRAFLAERYGRRLQPFLMHVRADSAPMDDEEFFWRLHFLLGAVIFTLSNFHTLARIEQETFDREAEIERILHRLVPVLAAGLQARADKTRYCWL